MVYNISVTFLHLVEGVMYLEFADNHGKKYIRVCETIRVTDEVTHKSKTKKKTIQNIGPVARFDDGKPDFIARLKASFESGRPIIEELRPYVSKEVKQEIYNIRLVEGTDECIGSPKLVSNLLLEKMFEELDLSQLIRSYKNRYEASYDVYGFLKLLVFSRLLDPSSKWATVQKRVNYALPIIKDEMQEFSVYNCLDFIYEHRRAIFNRINSTMIRNYHRTTDRIYYDVTNFFFATDEGDADEEMPDGNIKSGLRKPGVSKEHRKSPIVQMGLLMDEQGIPISCECFPGNTLDQMTLSAAFRSSVDTVSSNDNRFIYVCDKGIGKGESIGYAIANGLGYLTSRTVRGSSKEEKDWILDENGYVSVSSGFKYKTRIIKKKTTVNGTTHEYAEKVLTYWSEKFFKKEIAEKADFYAFMQEFIKNPNGFRVSKTQLATLRKYIKPEFINKKTGEVTKSSDLTAVLDVEKLKKDYSLLGYYTLVTSEIHMDDMEIINTYGNLVGIEEQFRIMKSTLDARPVFVRKPEHIIAHLDICVLALILIRLIQRQLKEKFSELVDNNMLFCDGLSADRIQSALNKWKIEKLGDTYFRFCDIDDPDLSMILRSFGVNIEKKCYRLNEIRQLKSKIEMST